MHPRSGVPGAVNNAYFRDNIYDYFMKHPHLHNFKRVQAKPTRSRLINNYSWRKFAACYDRDLRLNWAINSVDFSVDEGESYLKGLQIFHDYAPWQVLFRSLFSYLT